MLIWWNEGKNLTQLLGFSIFVDTWVEDDASGCMEEQWDRVTSQQISWTISRVKLQSTARSITDFVICVMFVYLLLLMMLWIAVPNFEILEMYNHPLAFLIKQHDKCNSSCFCFVFLYVNCRCLRRAYEQSRWVQTSGSITLVSTSKNSCLRRIQGSKLSAEASKYKWYF